MSHALVPLAVLGSVLSLAFAPGCGNKDEGDDGDGGSEDGGTEDGGSEDGGTEDGGTEDGGTEDGGTEDGGADGGAEGCVPTADGTLPDGLTELSWDDGTGLYTLLDTGWYLGDYALAEEPIHQWNRFEPDVPVAVHGVTIMLDQLPDDPETPVTVGLYDDFGYNGFDAWYPEPLWEGTLCAGDLEEGEWITFVLEEPVEVPGGELVFGGHYREGEDDVAVLMDGSFEGDGSCTLWDDCHAAVNMPDVTELVSGGYSYTFWKGWSGLLPYDWMIRLQVEELAEVPGDDETVFAWQEGGPTGSRQAWGDFDADGNEDLWITGTLYQGNGNGTFTDVTDASGISSLGVTASGGVWGDYDDDGCLDLFVFAESYSAGDSLLHNQCDGTFTDATATAGIVDDLDGSDSCSAAHAPSAAAAWWDMDADGDLDLYVSNFICWDAYTYYTDQVWRNDGDGSFTEVTGELGFSSSEYASRGAAPLDHDGDGDVDLLVNNYVLHRNLFYDNQGDGTVDEAAVDRGLAGNADDYYGSTYYGHSIGTAWGDLDNDGDWDSVVANLAHPRFFSFSDKSQVLLNDGSGSYADNAGDWDSPYSDNGLRYQETHSVPSLHDFDGDGVLDLAITAVYDGRPMDFYWGNGDGSFTLAMFGSGLTTESGWGMSAGDADNDGDVDLATSGGFFLNQGDPGSFVEVRPVGTLGSNRAGIGAVVHVTDDTGAVRMRQVSGGNGQGEQDSAFLHFGLGEATAVESITVAFVGGETVEVEGPWEVGQRLWVSESGEVASGWDGPGWHGPVAEE